MTLPSRDTPGPDPSVRDGFDAALRELQHQAAHLEARGAHRAAATLYDAIRIARLGGLDCGEHQADELSPSIPADGGRH